MTTTFSFRPCFLNAASIPEPTAAWFSKREWIQGTFQAVSGYGVEKTSRHPVGETTMVFFPAAFRMSRAASAGPQPPQARWPQSKSSRVLSMGSYATPSRRP